MRELQPTAKHEKVQLHIFVELDVARGPRATTLPVICNLTRTQDGFPQLGPPLHHHGRCKSARLCASASWGGGPCWSQAFAGSRHTSFRSTSKAKASATCHPARRNDAISDVRQFWWGQLRSEGDAGANQRGAAGDGGLAQHPGFHQGQSADAAVRLQRHIGEHPAELVGALRDRRRAGRRAHPTRNQGLQQLANDSAAVPRRRVHRRRRHRDRVVPVWRVTRDDRSGGSIVV